MEWLIAIFGRFHPMVVHFPIGILMLAFFFELVSRSARYRSLRTAVPAMLTIGGVFSVFAVASGLALREEGGYDEGLLDVHQILGIATATVSVLASLFYGKLAAAKTNSFLNLISTGIVALFVSLAGHWGGTITHGESYFMFASAGLEISSDPADRLRAISNIDSVNFYADVVQPILEARCYSCHSASKIKGDLRLDEVTFIKQGGESGKIIYPGMPDSSSLYHRMSLPLEHEDHMPPNQKPQPSSAEMALIQSWIENGASFEEKVYQASNADKVKLYFASLVTRTESESLLPDDPVQPADEKAVQALRDHLVMVLPVAKESNYLSISFVNNRNISAPDMKQLLVLKDHIVWLDLSHTNADDSCLAVISTLRELRKLNLQNTSITNAGLSSISNMSELVYLNLVGTSVTDAGLQHLESLNNLASIYLFQTAVTNVGLSNLATTFPTINIDTGGYALPLIAADTTDVFASP